MTNPNNPPFDPNQALEKVAEKVTLPLTLQSRPNDPKTPDDLYGHILSLRAEHLTTLALLIALADHLGIDVETLVANARPTWTT